MIYIFEYNHIAHKPKQVNNVIKKYGHKPTALGHC